MKINKLFCLDEEIAKKLEGINASFLVNKLLIEHFNEEISENLDILKKKFSENREILKESKRKDKQLRAFIDKIEAKEKKIVSLSKGLSDNQIRILRGMPENLSVIAWKYYKKDFPEFTYSQITQLKGGLR